MASAGVKFMSLNRHGDAERHVRGERTAGVAIGGDRDGDSCVDHPARVRPLRPVENSAPGRSVATVEPAASASMSSSVAYVQWSTDAAPSSTASLNTVAWPELAGVYARLQPRGHARGEDDTRLIDVECTPVTEHIDPSSGRLAGRKHRTRHKLYVAFAVVPVIGGHDVGTEKRCLAGESPCQLPAIALRRRRSGRTRSSFRTSSHPRGAVRPPNA